MSDRCDSRRAARLVVVALALAIGFLVHRPITAQQPAGPPQPPASPRAAAPIDLTGYWVSIVTEDWRWRMVTPPKGDYASIPLNPEGRKVADTWDPAKAAGGAQCEAYGAAAVMRMPGRLHITWEGENTLKIETDAGQQTRFLHFDKAQVSRGDRQLQGRSLAEWDVPPAGRGGGGGGGGAAQQGAQNQNLGATPPGAAETAQATAAGGAPPPAAGAPAGRGPAAGRPRGGSLKVVTTNMRAGYLRKNGVPYSENAVLTEYFDRFASPDGDEWFVVTSIVDDPKYLNQQFITSSHFKKEANNAKWSPTPCKTN